MPTDIHREAAAYGTGQADEKRAPENSVPIPWTSLVTAHRYEQEPEDLGLENGETRRDKTSNKPWSDVISAGRGHISPPNMLI
jgi:hypothetical protein